MSGRRVTLKPTDPLDEVRGKLAAASGHVTFCVYGTPAPQGSKRGFVNRSGGVSMVESSAKVKPWRQDVKHAALDFLAAGDPITGPVRVDITFLLARPKGHYRTGKNSALLRDSAPEFPAVKPDVDKLLRSTLDALGEAGVWKDDAQVVGANVWKLYADPKVPGAYVVIQAMEAA